LDITRRKMKNRFFLKEIYARILRCRFSCTQSIQQLAGLTLLPGHNTASSNSFLKYLGYCNLEYPMFHQIVYTCFSFALVLLGSSCAWFVASLFFSPENGGFVPVLFWTGCLYLRKLLVWHCIKWSCGKVHLPGLKQISCKQHPFNSSKLWHWRILRELIEIAVGLKLLCIFYWFHPWQCCQMELSKIVLGFCAFWLGLLCSIVTRMEQFKEMWPVFLDGCWLQ